MRAAPLATRSVAASPRRAGEPPRLSPDVPRPPPVGRDAAAAGCRIRARDAGASLVGHGWSPSRRRRSLCCRDGRLAAQCGEATRGGFDVRRPLSHGIRCGPLERKATSGLGWRCFSDAMEYVRRRPTLPPPLGGSTIGAGRLNFRVRDGSGCFPVAMAAVTLCPLLGRVGGPGGRSVVAYLVVDTGGLFGVG